MPTINSDIGYKAHDRSFTSRSLCPIVLEPVCVNKMYRMLVLLCTILQSNFTNVLKIYNTYSYGYFWFRHKFKCTAIGSSYLSLSIKSEYWIFTQTS